MKCQEAIQILHKALPGLKGRFGIVDLALFGSVARNEAGPESDVDILVTFAGPATFDGYMDLQESLETLLGREVDLVTSKAVKPLLRPYIEQDLVHVP